jgi:predicted GH43/DUF377 family glycosyl hydrolase
MVGGPQVLFDGSTYTMFFHGFSGGSWRIGMATSPDGIRFTESAQNPVMNLGSGWESVSTFEHSVIRESDGFTMWYTGYDGVNLRIGRATSPDGVSWTRDPLNPLLGVGAGGEPKSAQTPTVVKIRKTYYMNYSALSNGRWQMAFATSIDGRTWVPSPSFPIVPLVAGTFHSAGMYGPAALLVDGDLAYFWTPTFDGSRWTTGLLQQNTP